MIARFLAKWHNGVTINWDGEEWVKQFRNEGKHQGFSFEPTWTLRFHLGIQAKKKKKCRQLEVYSYEMEIVNLMIFNKHSRPKDEIWWDYACKFYIIYICYPVFPFYYYLVFLYIIYVWYIFWIFLKPNLWSFYLSFILKKTCIVCLFL